MTPREAWRNLPRRWYIPVTLDICEVAEHLTEAEYEKYKKVCPELNLNLHFDYTPPSPDVGIMEGYFEWNGDWSLPPIGNYPDKVKDAITAFLETTDVNAKWGGKAGDQAETYISQTLYPDA